MAWIESHQGLEKHPKTLRLMATMGWDLDQTLGKLHRFWWWCVDHAPDGDLRKFGDDVLGAAVGLLMADGEKFVNAMVDAGGAGRGDGNVPSGFLERKPYFRVHDWWGYFGPFLKVKFKHSPEKWKAIRDLYETGDANPPNNGDNNRSKNGSNNGDENGDDPPRPPHTPPSPTLTETVTTLQDRGGDAAIVEIAVSGKTPQAQLLELFKAAYEFQLPTQQYKIDRADYIVAAKLITDFGLEAVVDKARTLFKLCRDESVYFTDSGFGAFGVKTLSAHWNRIIPTKKKATPEKAASDELKRQEELRARARRIAG